MGKKSAYGSKRDKYRSASDRSLEDSRFHAVIQHLRQGRIAKPCDGNLPSFQQLVVLGDLKMGHPV
jgi:hypothetical protein